MGVDVFPMESISNDIPVVRKTSFIKAVQVRINTCEFFGCDTQASATEDLTLSAECVHI